MRITNERVKSVFSEYPPLIRKKLKSLRELIMEVANNISEIDDLVETLKWGEPSYLPKNKNVGTTVRIHWLKSKPEQYGIYFNCQTNLISQFKKKYSGLFNYEGKRAIIFHIEEDIPVKEIRDCIAMALTYHLTKIQSTGKIY